MPGYDFYSPGAKAAIQQANATYNAQRAAARNAPDGGAVNPNTPGGILAGQESAINALRYTPIDIAALRTQAEQAAANNAANSIALERRFSPGVADARQGLQTQIASDLASGGALPADVQTQIGRVSGAQAGASGLLGSQAPATAASLGLTSLQLRNQRQNAAGNLLALNPLPESGLSPGDLASLSVANTNAQNAFDLQKLGAMGNIANSRVAQLQSDFERQAGQPVFSYDSAIGASPTQTFSSQPSGDAAYLRRQAERDQIYNNNVNRTARNTQSSLLTSLGPITLGRLGY